MTIERKLPAGIEACDRMDREAISKRFGISLRAIQRLVSDGKFPPALPLPTMRQWWATSVIEDYFANLITGAGKVKEPAEQATG